MPRFSRVEIESVVDKLPGPARIQAERERCDLFVVALGFEDRCPALAAVVRAGGDQSRAIIAEYSTNVEDNEHQRQMLSDALTSAGFAVTYEPIADGTFLGALQYELAQVGSEHGRARVLVDVSVMTSSLILGVLRVVTSVPDIELVVGYTEALSYGPTREEFETLYDRSSELTEVLDSSGLSVAHGVSEIRYSVDFQGSHVPGLEDLVVILPGFGRDRASAAISFVNPAYLLAPDGHVKWLVGAPLKSDNQWRVDALMRANGIRGRDVIGRVSEANYQEVVLALDAVFRRSQYQENLTVVPLGTKLQTLAVCIHGLIRPSVRVLVADSGFYLADAYSQGVGDSMLLDFGHVGGLLAILKSVDSLMVVQNGD